MTPEEQQEAYRAKCTHARVGKTIINLDSEKKAQFKTINEAKRWVRDNAPFKTYAIK